MVTLKQHLGLITTDVTIVTCSSVSDKTRLNVTNQISHKSAERKPGNDASACLFQQHHRLASCSFTHIHTKLKFLCQIEKIHKAALISLYPWTSCESTSMEECTFLQSYLLPYLHRGRLAFCPSRGHALNFIQLIQKCAINPRLFTCFHKVVGPS